MEASRYYTSTVTTVITQRRSTSNSWNCDIVTVADCDSHQCNCNSTVVPVVVVAVTHPEITCQYNAFQKRLQLHGVAHDDKMLSAATVPGTWFFSE